MNRDEFLGLCKNPDLVLVDHSVQLKGLVDRYPYFQAARILFAIAQKKGKQIGFSDALKSAALHSSNRRKLFYLLEGKNTRVIQLKEPEQEATAVFVNSNLEEPEVKVAETGIQEEELIKDISTYPIIKKSEEKESSGFKREEVFGEEEFEINASIEVQKEVQKENESEVIDSHSFLGWLNQLKRTEQITTKSKTVEPRKSEEEIIEEFIKTEPRISAPEKKEFYSPLGMAKKSILDSEEIVSETLATIYAKQGNLEKAIRIYQKLSLLYPDKSSYFAALIKKLENPDIS